MSSQRNGFRRPHKQAEQDALAREYDAFYGARRTAPPSDMTAIGDQIAADVIQQREAIRRRGLRPAEREMWFPGNGWSG